MIKKGSEVFVEKDFYDLDIEAPRELNERVLYYKANKTYVVDHTYNVDGKTCCVVLAEMGHFYGTSDVKWKER